MATNINMEMANREVANLVFVDFVSKKPFLNVDYANVSTTELTGESVYAYGGWGHPKRITFFGERGGTISFETQITPFKLYSMITGAEVETGANWLKREVVTATEAGKLTISDTTASEVSVFAFDDDCGTEIEGASVTGGAVTATGVKKDDKYVVYYMQTLTEAKKLSITNTTFPSYFTAYAETKDKTENGEDALYRLVAYKCAPQTDFSLEFSNTGDPASITVTCDLMLDEDGNMLDMILSDE